MSGPRILVVRLGSMGDVIHTLPAAATLKHSFPHSSLSWVIDPKWAPLLAGNPFVDSVIPLNRRSFASIRKALGMLREAPFDLAVDFQGLIKSAVIATCARPARIAGFHPSQVRERPAALFYSLAHKATAIHVVDRNLELAAAAGASNLLHLFPLPPGRQEDVLPEGDFVLASPLAGWGSKQWPLGSFAVLAARLKEQLGIPLVLDGPASARATLASVPAAVPHVSNIDGLICATRRARAVVGVDSGPLHIAAALAKPGVAIFGPTSPERNGPYGGSLTVLRDPDAITSYKRRTETDPSMQAISVDAVFYALRECL